MIKINIIARTDDIILRDRIPKDVDGYIKWQTTGEWLEYDAPWENIELTEDILNEKRAKFIDSCKRELPVPRKNAIIATPENIPIGWVNRYPHKNSPDAWHLGIDICEDGHLNKGFGTLALSLWIDYLFRNSSFHRLGLETWSFNKRMIKVADKTGFRLEGTQREVRKWNGEWLDLLNFGMLRSEWKG